MKRSKIAVCFMVLGSALMLAAGSLFAYNRWDENRASDAALHTADLLATFIYEQAGKGATNPDDLYGDEDDYHDELEEETPEDDGYNHQPIVMFDGNNYLGVLNISTLELTLPVMEFWNYDKLKISPCRYTGDLRDDNMVVMAHNYSRHFGNISKLQYGDLITFTDANGLEYSYEVAEIETVNSTDIDGMIHNEYDFTLFTCTYNGQARVAVRCLSI